MDISQKVKKMHSLALAFVLAVTSITANSNEYENNTQPELGLMSDEPVGIQSSGYSLAGFGYSSDTQQLTTQRCYNGKISYIGEQKQVVHLSSAASFSSLEQELGVSVSAEASYNKFSASAEANYFRSLQEKDHTLSLNYYQYTSNKVTVEIGNDVLTDFGKRLYAEGTNRLFGVTCGDQYVGSYQQGALLVMGLNIKLPSLKEKLNFNARANASYGSIVSAAASVKAVGENNKIAGSVEVHAFQIGGEPGQLSKIFKKDAEGKYYAFSCSIDAMDKCQQVASGLLDYATEVFPTQISTKNNQGLTPLGIPFTNFQPITRLGLTPPASLVTAEIEQFRIYLYKKLMENEYYQQKLHPFFNNGYPVPLDDSTRRKVDAFYAKVDRNIHLLMKPHGGAADCFHFPENCKDVKTKIESHLQPITFHDLNFLDNIKYMIPICFAGMFYGTGSGTANSWAAVGVVDGDELTSVVITSDKYSYRFVNNGLVTAYDGVNTGTPLQFRGDANAYVGTAHVSSKPGIVIKAVLSPFHFESFK